MTTFLEKGRIKIWAKLKNKVKLYYSSFENHLCFLPGNYTLLIALNRLFTLTSPFENNI